MTNMVSSRQILLLAFTGLSGASGVSASSKAAQVYFYPPNPTFLHEPPAVNAPDAQILLAHHLGFEIYEEIGDNSEGWWSHLVHPTKDSIGQGPHGSTLIVIQSDNPEDITPKTIRPSFLIPNPPPASSFTDLIHAYVEKAHHLFSSVFSSLENVISSSSTYKSLLDLFDMATEAASMFVDELSQLLELVEKDEPDTGSDHFSAYEVKGLAEIQTEHGRDSEEYVTAAKSMQAFLSNPSLQSRRVAIIVVPSERKLHSRSDIDSSAPHSSGNRNKVVFSVSTCYADNTTCVESTQNCSGHGTCNEVKKAGKSCFTCSCLVTKDAKGRNEYWAGESCQKIDISTSFTLLAGSVIFLFFLVIFSVSLLYSVGDESLPNTLTAAASAPHSKRD